MVLTYRDGGSILVVQEVVLTNDCSNNIPLILNGQTFTRPLYHQNNLPLRSS